MPEPAAVTAEATAEAAPGATAGAASGAPVRRLTDFVAGWSEQRRRAAVAVMAIAAVVVSWLFRFVQDDAFITFRYSRNFARGEGLVLNHGERVEGYTNFLWTWLMAIPERQGWSAPAFSVVVTLVLLALTVPVANKLARLVFDDDRMALLATAALVANMSFVGYGTGGLETMLQTLLVTGVAVLVLPVEGRGHAVVRYLVAGVLGGLACLTRLDSAVLVGTWFVLVVVVEWRRVSLPKATASAAALGIPLAAVIVPWLVWKYDYYGSILPNTLTAKSGGFIVPFLYGVFYLLAFGVSYFAFLLIRRYRAHRAEWFANPRARLVSIPVLVWLLYTCVVGADFMEFRFMVPIIPILALLAAFLLNTFTDLRRHLVLIGVLLAVSATHLVMPTIIPYPVLTFAELRHWPTESKTSWVGLGRYLRETFPGGERAPGQPVLAIQPLGAIGYESDLPVVDMLGLADKDIARHGTLIPLYYPGHVRMATVAQLEAKHVDLIAGLPTFATADPKRTSVRFSELLGLYSNANLNDLPADASVLEVPLTGETVDEGSVWWIIELRHNAKVDALVDAGTWRRLDIDRMCRKSDLNVLTERLDDGTCKQAGFS